MVLKVKELRQMNPEERNEKLKELKEELMHERGVSAMGGSSPSPGKIRQIRQSIARILTIMQEEGEHK
jgi:large subunit ribosomal protein L29